MLVLKLILAHLIGDFFLQPKAWVEKKERKVWKSKELYFHAIIHGTLVLMILWGTGAEWMLTGWVSGTVLVTHFVIDGLKLSLQNKKSRRAWFFADQVLHIGVIIAIWAVIHSDYTFFEWLKNDQTLVMLTCVLFLTQPLAIIVKVLISRFIPVNKKQKSDDSLANAGKFIGILERLLVFGFVVMGSWEGVGFLLAAKSVFRFGDLRDKEDRELTEYILIGTLLSFGAAILTAVIYKILIQAL